MKTQCMWSQPLKYKQCEKALLRGMPVLCWLQRPHISLTSSTLLASDCVTYVLGLAGCAMATAGCLLHCSEPGWPWSSVPQPCSHSRSSHPSWFYCQWGGETCWKADGRLAAKEYVINIQSWNGYFRGERDPVFERNWSRGPVDGDYL